MIGEAEPASPFQFNYNHHNISPFPIAEYPRPIQRGDILKRQSLLSNRRLRIQTRHADLSARLCHAHDNQTDHLIFGRIDFTAWSKLVNGLHTRAHWVACIDPFVDKRLLRTAEGQERRKILGFTSGLGAYGELNLSISTEQDTLSQLAARVRGELVELLPFQDAAGFEKMAECVIEESEEIIGLSAIHAVVGEGQKVREVVGFAAIRRLLAIPSTAAMTQLLPIDSLLHWFKGGETSHRPDLLQLALILPDSTSTSDVPLIQATLIECKLSQHNPEHLNKARLQTQDGLSHLTQLLIPNRCDIQRTSFDRRYWWAQLQRAITSRSEVNLSESDWRQLDKALEQITEGYFNIVWRAAIFTFWTDIEGATPSLTSIPLPAGIIQPPFSIPEGFAIQHITLGHDGLVALFDDQIPNERLKLDSCEIRIETAVESITSIMPPVLPVPAPDEFDQLEPEQEPELKPTPTLTPTSIEPLLSAIDELRITPAPTSNTPINFALPEQLLIGTRANGEPVLLALWPPAITESAFTGVWCRRFR